jgi:hypothetical protein
MQVKVRRMSDEGFRQRGRAVPVAAQIWDHDGERLGKVWGDFVPGDMGLWIAVDEEYRRTRAAQAEVDFRVPCGNALACKPWKHKFPSHLRGWHDPCCAVCPSHPEGVCCSSDCRLELGGMQRRSLRTSGTPFGSPLEGQRALIHSSGGMASHGVEDWPSGLTQQSLS